MSPVFPKLLFVVVSTFLTACALLAMRQQRIEAAHELVDVHQRVLERRRALWELQVAIDEQCRPDAVRDMMEELGVEWRTLTDPPIVPPAPVASQQDAQDAPAATTEAPTEAVEADGEALGG